MSKELKDLIDKAEEEQQIKAYLEKTIEQLQLEVDKLKTKLESKVTFKPTPIKHITDQSESQEIIVLKDMVSSLSQKLDKKEEEKQLLQDKVKDLTLELEEVKEELSSSLKDEMLSRTQNSLNTLIQDYGRLEQENKTLKKKLVDLSNEIESTTEAVSSFKAESSMNLQLKNEIANLKQKISSFELENKSLAKNLDVLKNKQVSTEKLDNLVEALKSNNFRLAEENKALNEKLETLKREKLKIFKLESQITNLNEKVEELEQKNKELREKDTILLAKTITALQHHEKKETVKPDIFISKTPAPSIEEDQSTINKINQLSTTITKSVIKPYIADAIIESKKLKEENVLEPELEIEEDDFTRKWQCPNCGNSNKAYIREIDDKTRLIYAYPKIYAKKYKCGQCGTEWK